MSLLTELQVGWITTWTTNMSLLTELNPRDPHSLSKLNSTSEAQPLINHQHNFPKALVRLNAFVGRAHFLHLKDLVYHRPDRARR